MAPTTEEEGKVDVEELLEFIFPKSLQHPLSTGRLYAFGIYGPLDSNAKLRAGSHGHRVVSTWEIDTMCLQFEREDILQVYISGGRPLFVLSEAQKEEVIAQADSYLKTAKGRGFRRQVTRPEVVELLSGLPRDASGLVSFHDAQKLIMKYRKNQIARFRVIFPEVVAGFTKQKSKRSTEQTGAASGGRSSDGSDAVTRSRVGRRAKFSADVAPAEMFIKDAGLTSAGVANHTSKLLSTRAYRVSNIADGNDPGLTQNVKLIREDRALEQGYGVWDPYACLRGSNIGSHVRSAKSSTTAKRKC